MAQTINGALGIVDAQGKKRIELIADENGESSIFLKMNDGKPSLSYKGGAFILFDKDGNELMNLKGKSDLSLSLIHSLFVGTGKYDGYLEVRDKSGACVIRLDGEFPGIEVGREGKGGVISVKNEKKEIVFLARSLDNKGVIHIGSPTNGATVGIMGKNGKNNIEIDGEGILRIKGKNQVNIDGNGIISPDFVLESRK